jgi:acetylornithine aminotransferase
VLTAGKALGGGLPVGACVIAPEVGEGLVLGEHGSTFAGGAICARAALEAISILSEPALLEAVGERGEEVRAMLGGHPGVEAIRGRGLMLGLALSPGLDAAEIARAALAAGVVVNAPNPATIRLLPPLTVSSGELAQGIGRLRDAIDRAVPAPS